RRLDRQIVDGKLERAAGVDKETGAFTRLPGNVHAPDEAAATGIVDAGRLRLLVAESEGGLDLGENSLGQKRAVEAHRKNGTGRASRRGKNLGAGTAHGAITVADGAPDRGVDR